MGRHSEAANALKVLKRYCEDTEDCGKCVLLPCCGPGYAFKKEQMEAVEILRKRLERVDGRKVRLV